MRRPGKELWSRTPREGECGHSKGVLWKNRLDCEEGERSQREGWTITLAYSQIERGRVIY